MFTDKRGDPREVILGFCEENNATILVMGSRGLGFSKRMLVGSVSEYCVQHSTCPVVVVREPSN